MPSLGFKVDNHDVLTPLLKNNDGKRLLLGTPWLSTGSYCHIACHIVQWSKGGYKSRVYNVRIGGEERKCYKNDKLLRKGIDICISSRTRRDE